MWCKTMSDIAIRVDHLSKRYRIGEREPYGALRDVLSNAMTAPFRAVAAIARKSGPDRSNDRASKNHFWALKDVSFEIKRGEVVGIIGRNGAGKSTLLKLLSRITRPTEGYAEIHGRVGSLLEVGTGFHPELTGHENIYLNGAILGMSRAEVKQKFDEIVEFAGIDQFLETPVKRYSSGMRMRLAFAVAAHLEPEILLIDEVLAVGDAAFQKKCLGKMRDIASGSGRTIFFVSHNLQAVQNLCDRGIFLRGGQIAFDGPVNDTVRHYLDYLQEGTKMSIEDNPDRRGNGPLKLKRVYTSNAQGEIGEDFVGGEPLTFNFEYVCLGQCKNVSVGCTIFNQFGVACTHINTSFVNLDLEAVGESGRIVCRLPRNPLPIGEYRVSVVMNANGERSDIIPGCLAFRVVSSRFFPSTKVSSTTYCPVLVDQEWQHALD